ncbi:MAG TPA: hypothetical protein VHN99_07955 [Deinococcales bacterium]|nr:hypothetical protein [Deinococcales bacterium]
MELLLEVLKGAASAAGPFLIDRLTEWLKGRSVPTDALLEAVAPVFRDAAGHGGRLTAAKRLELQAKLDTALALVDKGV